MRKRLWQLHSVLGLVAGLGLLVLGLSGSLLVFREELEVAVNPEFLAVEPTPAGRLPLDTLRASVNRSLPDYELTGWQVRPPGDAAYADMLYLIRRGTADWQMATLDPYTGAILATPRAYTGSLTGWLYALHQSFLAGHVGEVLVGVFGAVFCLLGVTGVWIYRGFWKNLLTLRWGRGARILFSDLHRFVGISSVAFNLLVGFTGAYWNLSHAIEEAVQGEFPQPVIDRRLYSEQVSLDEVVAEAARHIPGFRSNFISLPSAPEGKIILWGAPEDSSPLRSPYGSTVTFDAWTGAFEAADDLRQKGFWAQLVDAFEPLHFGTFGSWPVQVLWTLLGLAPAVLTISGTLIFVRRKRLGLEA